MTIQLTLKDSTLFGEDRPSKDYREATACIAAVDELARQFSNGKVKLLSLSSYHVSNNNECPIWYEIISTITAPKIDCVIPATTIFYSSHYIGYCHIKDVSITIFPRFGEKLLSYLLNYACNLYIPHAKMSYHSLQSEQKNFLLMTLLWRAMLEKAINYGQIPKQYITESKLIPNFKGHLDISKHIHSSLVNNNQFYCSYRKLSYNNIINRTIRYTYSLLSKNNSGFSTAIEKINGYDSKLASLGVDNIPVNVDEIDNIKYTKMNYIYKPVMNFSRIIISHKEVEQNGKNGNVEFSYFVDIAEIWELYLIKLLQKNLSPDYRVFSLNTGDGDSLFNSDYRKIRPDIIIERNGAVVMIIDAKYKNYRSFGRTAALGISTEDLYQMITYLYHYGYESKPIIGLFVAPVSNIISNDINILKNKSNHKIGLLNLDIVSVGEDIPLLRNQEQIFITSIKKLLTEIN